MQPNKPIEVEELHRDRPAIGVIATDNNGDAIARIAIRANRRGYSVLVAYNGNIDRRSIEIAEEASAIVVSSVDSEVLDDTYEYYLTEAARSLGFPGLVVHRNTEEYIDYDAVEETTADAGMDFFTVESRTSTHRPQRGEIIAGIPAYNEETRIADVVEETRPYVDMTVVVDDGSDDDTAEAARRAGAVVVEHARNRGYGVALKTLFEEAQRRDAEHLVILDGDGQHTPADIPKLIDRQQESGAELIVGDRFGDGAKSDVPLYRRFGLTVINVLTNLSMGVVRSHSWVNDTQNGFRAYDREAIRSLAETDSLGDHMSASTDILHHAHNHDYDIEEVGTTVRYDIENASTHNPVTHGAVLVKNILRTIERERPLLVLTFPGFVSSFIGLGLGYWTVSTYLLTNDFPLELATVASFTTLVGLLACFTGIILHSLNTHYP